MVSRRRDAEQEGRRQAEKEGGCPSPGPAEPEGGQQKQAPRQQAEQRGDIVAAPHEDPAEQPGEQPPSRPLRPQEHVGKGVQIEQAHAVGEGVVARAVPPVEAVEGRRDELDGQEQQGGGGAGPVLPVPAGAPADQGAAQFESAQQEAGQHDHRRQPVEPLGEDAGREGHEGHGGEAPLPGAPVSPDHPPYGGQEALAVLDGIVGIEAVGVVVRAGPGIAALQEDGDQ